MSEKDKQNDPLLEESSIFSDSLLQGICQSEDRLGQTDQVPDKYVPIHVSIYTYVCVCERVCSLEMHM